MKGLSLGCDFWDPGFTLPKYPLGGINEALVFMSLPGSLLDLFFRRPQVLSSSPFFPAFLSPCFRVIRTRHNAQKKARYGFPVYLPILA